MDSLGKIASVLGCDILELFVKPAMGEQQPQNLRRGRRSL
nr:hypothetical protein [Rhizobium leguminosarum]